MSAKRRLCKGVVVPSVVFGDETCNMGSAERRRLKGDEVSEEYVWSKWSNMNGESEE